MPCSSFQTETRRGARSTHPMLLSLSVIAFGLGLPFSSADAESRIGNTAIAHNDVSQLSASKAAPISVGDDVFANEEVKTGQDSAAKFVFSDETNLALGPTSTVKLDRFVYKGDTTYAKAVVNFAAGAFRFTTGGSEKKAYELKTTTATIGVRGTVFDVSVHAGVTNVTLIEGEIAICPRGRYDGDPRKLSKAQLKKFDCEDLKTSGQTARVTNRSASFSATPVNFAANNCGGDAGLCSATVTARSTVSPTTAALDPNNPALCYVNQD